jgi:predicted nucleotidyltransferase
MLPFVVGRLVAEISPLQIILFGSHARGDASRDSDLDLAVVVDDSKNLRESAVRLQVALSGTAIPTDIIVATPARRGKISTA